MPTTIRFLGPDSVKADSKEKVPTDVKKTKMKNTKMRWMSLEQKSTKLQFSIPI